MCSNAKTKVDEEDPQNKDTTDVYPSIAYFIVYTLTESCNDDTFFSALHNQDLEPTITPLTVRKSGRNEMETVARHLFQCLKDHNNNSIREMLNVSNVYCYENASGGSTDDDSDSEEMDKFHPKHFPTCPCVFTVVNHQGYFDAISTALDKLESDGLVHSSNVRSVWDSNHVTRTIRKITRAMEICRHALYRSGIYPLPDNAKLTYVRMMDVSTYLNKLLANDALNDDLLRNFQAVERVLSHPACEIVQQLQFDLDLIEVSNGFCFSISKREFVPNTIPASKIGKVSPWAFLEYDCSTPPQPRYFEEGILNSFPDLEERVNFLNKFYQCLFAFKMPQKTRKLVAAGPLDSGKTSWCKVFQQIIPPQYIASVTNEGQFSAAMITDLTQLTISDEWSSSKMRSDLAKTILQGGWMVTSIKHALPKCVNNNNPFYISTNNVPDFGEEDDNVKRRIRVFNTSSLPNTIPGIDSWIHDNAMDCIVWVTKEIDQHRDMIPTDELWHERCNKSVVNLVDGETLWKRYEVQEITKADLQPHQISDVQQPTIHPGFTAEVKPRRLARKRRKRKGLLSDSSNDEDEQPVSSNIAVNTNITDPIHEPTSHSQVDQPSTSIAQHEGDTLSDDESPSANVEPSPCGQVDEDKTTNQQQSAPLSNNLTETENADLPVVQEPARVDNDANDAEKTPPPYDSFTTRYSSTPAGGWVLNSLEYFDKVANYLQCNLYQDLKKAHVHSFLQRRDNAKMTVVMAFLFEEQLSKRNDQIEDGTICSVSIRVPF